MTFVWVTMRKAAEETGYTVAALRSKIKTGTLTQGVHWKYAPDGKILIHRVNFIAWMEQ